MDLQRAEKKMKAMMGNLPLKNKRLENITKVTFETESGKTFTFFNARVWKLDLAGNLAYQIRGEYPDLEEVLKDDAPATPVLPAEQPEPKSENNVV